MMNRMVCNQKDMSKKELCFLFDKIDKESFLHEKQIIKSERYFFQFDQLKVSITELINFLRDLPSIMTISDIVFSQTRPDLIRLLGI